MGAVGSVAYNYENTKALTPGTAAIEWTIGTTTYSMTDDGKGNLSGNGTGTINYASGQVEFKANPAPRPVDGSYRITATRWGGASVITETLVPAQQSITYTAENPPIRAGSLSVMVDMKRIREVIDYTKFQPGATADERREYTFTAVARDNGDGLLLRGKEQVGTVDYLTGEMTFDLRLPYTYQLLKEQGGVMNGGRFRAYDGQQAVEEYNLDKDVRVRYTAPTDPENVLDILRPIDGLTLDIIPGTPRPIIPGSLLFRFAGQLYRDRAGSLVSNWSPITDAGDNVGSIDYATGEATLSDWPAGADLRTPVELLACLTWYGERTSYYSKFRTAGSPLRQGSLIVNAVAEDGTEVSVQAATDGSLTHPLIVEGSVETQTGTVSIEWTQPIYPTSLKYSAVAFKYLPLDPDLIGLDPTRLPSDGRVPIFLPGDVGVVSHTIETSVASPTAGQTLAFTRTHQAEVWVRGANGRILDPMQYTLDRTAGALTWSATLSLVDEEGQAVTTPVVVSDRVEDMVLITDVQVSGQVGFNAQLSQDYPAGEATLSSAVLHGDLRARVHTLFHQASWTSEWSDQRIGNDTTAKYNEVAYPLEITNQGSIKERWLVRFTSGTSFEVVGETVGVIANGNISADVAVLNPATGAPYFTIRADGWGSGWNAGNCLRFNTDGAQSPFWIARTILSGPATAEEDSFSTQNRGDAD